MPNSKLHKALLIVQTHINAQLEALGSAFGMLRTQFEEVKTSSVYLAFSEPGKTQNPTGQLVFAATVITHRDAQAVQELLTAYMEDHPRSVDIYIMSFDDLTRLSPNLTLPHPDFHLKPQWLIPAAEIWGEYEHPILVKPLHELAGSHDWGAWGQFYAQGEKLYEFSQLKNQQ